MAPVRRNSDRGFTIVEIIVALVIIMIAIGAAAAVLGAGSNAQSRTKIISRQKSTASAVIKRATTDRSWLARNNCGVGMCGAGGSIPATDPVVAESIPTERDGTVRHDVVLIAEGVDLPNDGMGADDRDGIVPDLFRVRATNNVTALGLATNPQPYTATGTIDMSQRGTSGTIEIRTCRISPQIDERIGTGMCETAGTTTHDIAAPASCRLGTFDCDAWIQARSANPALHARVGVEPFAGVRYTLKGPMPQSTATRSIPATDAQGLARVRDLEPGQYQLTADATSVGDFTPWTTHSTPSGGYVTVSAGELRRAVQLFRPTRTAPVQLMIETVDKTDPGNIVVRPGAMMDASVKLMPIPTNRDLLESGGPRGGWTVITRGMRSVPLAAPTAGLVRPGLYASRMLAYPGTSTIPLRTGAQRYIWIPPGSAATSPAALTLRQEYCDNVRRATLVRAMCPVGYRYCFVNGAFYGGCNDTPPTNDGAVGSGGA